MAKSARMKQISIALLLMTPLGFAVGYLPDRRRLAPSERPFTSLARISAHGGRGCGTLVGPDLLLTCSHCVASEDGKLYTDIDVELGLGFKPVSHHAKVLESFKISGQDGGFGSGDDWAIVRLDRPLGRYYGWMESQVLDDKDWTRVVPELLGYCDCPDEARPEFGHMDKPYLCPGLVTHVGPKILYHDCSMWGGTSGAPLTLKDPKGTLTVVGITFAEVGVGGEKLPSGFRARYSKDLANLAIPAKRWQQQLSAVKPANNLPIRTFWVRNRSLRPIKIIARYRSIFLEPAASLRQTSEVTVPWQKRVLILKPEDGCTESEIQLCVTDERGNPIGPKAMVDVEVDGKILKFFKRSIGAAADYTTELP